MPENFYLKLPLNSNDSNWYSLWLCSQGQQSLFWLTKMPMGERVSGHEMNFLSRQRGDFKALLISLVLKHGAGVRSQKTACRNKMLYLIREKCTVLWVPEHERYHQFCSTLDSTVWSHNCGNTKNKLSLLLMYFLAPRVRELRIRTLLTSTNN